MQDNFSETEITAPRGLHEAFNFYIKREDLHPLGSHKHFAAEQQVAFLKKNNLRGVLPTSGNAGIATAYEARKQEAEAYIFVTPNTAPEKIEEISAQTKNIFLSEKAARFANYISAKYRFHNLRPSMDDLAVEGFENLGQEIAKQFEDQKQEPSQKLKEIYTFVTSGASYIGMYRGLQKLHKEGVLQEIPRMHCISGFAGRFGARHSPRKKTITQIIEATGGKEFEIGENELKKFKTKFPEIAEKLSDESMSSLAAAMQNSAGPQSLVVSTGKKWHGKKSEFNIETLRTLTSLQDCDELFS